MNILAKSLSPDEQSALAKCERGNRGLTEFLIEHNMTRSDFAAALRLLRGKKDYKKHGTFAQWVRNSFGISAGYAHMLMSSRVRNRKAAIGENLRWEIWERDNFTCCYCGSRRILEVDHKHPESLGGETIPSNLITACRRCNLKKGTRSFQQFILSLMKASWEKADENTRRSFEAWVANQQPTRADFDAWKIEGK